MNNPLNYIKDISTLVKSWCVIFSDVLSRLLKKRSAAVSIIVIAIYVVIAVSVFSSELFHVDAAVFRWDQTTGPSYQSPCGQNILGTDLFGQSVLRKTLFAARSTISVAVFASLITAFTGVALGMVAGYFGKAADSMIVWLYSTMSSVPWIILVMAFAVAIEGKRFLSLDLSGTAGMCIAIGLTGWCGLCRLVRSEVLKLKNSGYVLAAKAAGAGQLRILCVHLFPNIFSVVAVYVSIRFISFIHMQVILGFLGLGPKGQPSWGSMISNARMEIQQNVWWEMTAAVSAVFVLTLALNIFTNALRDAAQPKLDSKVL